MATLDQAVQNYSLSWHLKEQLSKAEMAEAARESLKALRLAEHQALIVCPRPLAVEVK